jgi:nucleoside-diphosphate-sugar epimerase
MNCVIGYTGFIGSYLFNALNIETGFNSKNIHLAKGSEFETIYCAAPSGTKWMANKNPQDDYDNIKSMMNSLSFIRAKEFVLLSTIDVYPEPLGENEDDETGGANHHAYGKHRLLLENFIKEHFENLFILRIPIIFGPKFKKNAIYDLMYDNEVEKIDPSRTTQIYDLRRLPKDIATVTQGEVRLVNLATEPVNLGDVATKIFEKDLSSYEPKSRSEYFMTTKNASLFGQNGKYICSSSEVMANILDFDKKYRKKTDLKL